MAEIWDAYDKQFNKIENVNLTRGASCIIINTEDPKKEG